MENATKALLIAASVLIVIVLVALGVALLNSSPDVTGQAKSVGESTAIQTFNGQFTSYLGNNQSAAMVRTVLTIIKASNKNSVNKVKVNGTEGGTYSPVDGHVYKIEAEYATDGRVNNIKITEPSA